MDIADIVSQEFVEFDPETRVSKLIGAFDDPAVKGVVVRGDRFEGVVTRRQLATSQHQPNEKVGSLVRHVPRLAPDEDIRKVAQLMLDGDAQVLPVFEGQDLVGVVTVDAVLETVRPHLDAVTVGEVCTDDLVSMAPDATFGDALNTLREHRVSHLPVVEDETPVGILSLYDVTGLTVRATQQSQGGDGGGTDPFGGELSAGSGRATGGFGAREGESQRILDLPVRDLMVSPVRTVEPTATVATAVDRMFEFGGSSLVVENDGTPDGIITKTDVLDALTWEAEGSRAVQVYGSSLLGDTSYEDIVALVDGFDDRDGGMSVLDAKVHLHEHDETRRGTPLLLARVRLHTDRGLYLGSGEGYGASQALNEARGVLERQIRDRKTRGKSKKPPSEAYWEKRFGWMLES
jgi:CBS domain-containing protein